jgi:hypothetical protein
MSLPAVLYIRDLRRVLDGWTRDRIRHFLVINGLALYDGKRVTYTTDLKLQELMPDAHRSMTAKWEAMRERRPFEPADEFADLD